MCSLLPYFLYLILYLFLSFSVFLISYNLSYIQFYVNFSSFHLSYFLSSHTSSLFLHMHIQHILTHTPFVITGFRVFVVPEAATVLFLNGASPDDFSKAGCAFAFQQFVIKYVTAQYSAVYCDLLPSLTPSFPLLHTHSTQMSLEDSFVNYALSTGQDSVILCDRGVMDGQAYVAEDTWRTVLQVRMCLRNYVLFLYVMIVFYKVLWY